MKILDDKKKEEAYHDIVFTLDFTDLFITLCIFFYNISLAFKKNLLSLK